MTEKSMYSGRVIAGSLQTAVQEYRHPDGRSILMVGCVHVAEPNYYVEVRKIVDEAEASGATVYMEGASFKDTSDGNASDEERSAIRSLRAALNTQYVDLPALLDLPWIYQGHSALTPYPDSWQPSDAREIDLVRLLGPSNAVGLAPSAGKYESFRQLKESKGVDSTTYIMARANWANSFIYPFKQLHWTARLLVRTLLRITRIIRRFAQLITRNPAPTDPRWMHPYIWPHRESIAALRALATKGNAVLLWHPSHMIGVGKILLRNGFEPQEPHHWLTACHKIEMTREKPNKKREHTTGVNVEADKGFTRGDAE